MQYDVEKKKKKEEYKCTLATPATFTLPNFSNLYSTLSAENV